MPRALVLLAVLSSGCRSAPASAPPRAEVPIGSVPAPRAAAPAEEGSTSKRAVCDAGDAAACVAIAESQRKGAPDADRARNTEALSLFEKACKADHPRGCEALAETLQDHAYYDVREDAEGAIRAWDKACRLDHQHACYRLGFYLWEGLTGGLVVGEDGAVRKYRWPQDRGRGLELMRRACLAGVRESCEHEKAAAGQP